MSKQHKAVERKQLLYFQVNLQNILQLAASFVITQFIHR